MSEQCNAAQSGNVTRWSNQYRSQAHAQGQMGRKRYKEGINAAKGCWHKGVKGSVSCQRQRVGPRTGEHIAGDEPNLTPV